MLSLRLEVCGLVLHIDLTKPGPPSPPETPILIPDSVSQPMTVYPDPPADPVAHRLGFEGRRGC